EPTLIGGLTLSSHMQLQRYYGITFLGGILCRLKWRMRAGVLADDPTAIAYHGTAVTFRVDIRQWSRIRRRNPKAQQMTLSLRLVPIHILGTVVKDRVIVEKLNIARPKLHIQPQVGVVCQAVEIVQRFKIQIAESPRVGKALGGLN